MFLILSFLRGLARLFYACLEDAHRKEIRGMCIKAVFLLSSGKTVFLECEKKEKLVKFYEDCGFSLLDNISYSKDKKELVQMFRFV